MEEWNLPEGAGPGAGLVAVAVYALRAFMRHRDTPSVPNPDWKQLQTDTRDLATMVLSVVSSCESLLRLASSHAAQLERSGSELSSVRAQLGDVQTQLAVLLERVPRTRGG